MTQAITPNLWQRLTKVYSEIEAIKKTGRNREQNYDYIEQALIVSTVRQALANNGIVLKTEMLGWETTEITYKSGSKGTKIMLTMRFTLINADNPTEREVFETWGGEGIDNSDKALIKASTVAQKYFLVRQFLISDKDPDEESPETATAKPLPAKKTAPAPVDVATGEVVEEWIASEVAQKLAEKYFAATSEEKFTAVNKEASAAGLDKPNRLWLNDQRKLALEAYNAVLRAEQEAS